MDIEIRRKRLQRMSETLTVVDSKFTDLFSTIKAVNLYTTREQELIIDGITSGLDDLQDKLRKFIDEVQK